MSDVADRLSELCIDLSHQPLIVEAIEHIKRLEDQLAEAIEGWRQAIAIAKAGRA